MKAKPYIFIIIISIFILSIQSAWAWGVISKAEDYLKANMKDQAIQVLENHILNNPLDAKVHMYLAKLYLKSGWETKAEKRFVSVYSIDKSYSKEIAQIYYQSAIEQKNKKECYSAEYCFQQAIKYNSAYSSNTNHRSNKINLLKFQIPRGFVNILNIKF